MNLPRMSSTGSPSGVSNNLLRGKAPATVKGKKLRTAQNGISPCSWQYYSLFSPRNSRQFQRMLCKLTLYTAIPVREGDAKSNRSKASNKRECKFQAYTKFALQAAFRRRRGDQMEFAVACCETNRRDAADECVDRDSARSSDRVAPYVKASTPASGSQFVTGSTNQPVVKSQQCIAPTPIAVAMRTLWNGDSSTNRDQWARQESAETRSDDARRFRAELQLSTTM